MSLFSQTVGNRPKRNAFDLSHERKFSMNMGDLVPILCEEIIPGDSWQCNTEVLLRMAPMLAPIMHRVNVYTHFFFVPYRLIWDDWEKFITGGEDGNEMPVRPYLHIPNVANWNIVTANGKLPDFLGFAKNKSSVERTGQLNILPFRAYHTIWNEYYRDQNLQEKFEFSKSSGSQALSSTWYTIRKRAWEKDYFTSALPWTQRGGDVVLPQGGVVPVELKNDTNATKTIIREYDTGNPWTNTNVSTAADGSLWDQLAGNSFGYIDPGDNLQVDLDNALGTTIEELRRATKLQQWLERNARGGSRYIEQILSHFGVISSDKRLQRPEFLGGGKTPVVISEVLQTSSTDTETPQANMAGHGISVGNSHKFRKSFEEHGYIMGIMSVLPKTSYQDGTRKHLRKDDKFDYYWPEFAQLGEQPVQMSELYDDYVDANRDETFGYQSRYAEYKYIPSSVHGDFKDTLSFWHMGRILTSAPALNGDFIKADTSAINTRCFAAGDSGFKLWCQVYHNIKAIRPIPKFNNPSLL